MSELRPNQIRILDRLAQTMGHVTLRDIKTNSTEMGELARRKLVEGAGSQGPRGWGVTPDTSWWKITMAGRRLLYDAKFGTDQP